jgi:hypothetical protein
MASPVPLKSSIALLLPVPSTYSEMNRSLGAAALATGALVAARMAAPAMSARRRRRDRWTEVPGDASDRDIAEILSWSGAAGRAVA